MKVFNHLFRLIALTALLVMAFQNCAKMKAQNLVPEESFDVTALSSDNGITLNEVPGEDDVNPDLINCANSTGGVFYAGQFHVCNVNIVELQRQFEAKCGVDFEGTGWNNSLIRFSNFSAGSSCQESVVNGALPSRGFRCDNPGLLTISFSAFTDIGSPGAPCSLRATKKVIVNPTNPNAFNYSQGLNVLSMVYKALLNREPDLPSSGGGAWGYLQMLMEPTRNAPSARNGTIAKVIRPIGDSSEFVFASLSIPPRESIRRYYAVLLGRCPQESEIQGWLDSGESLNEIAYNISLAVGFSTARAAAFNSANVPNCGPAPSEGPGNPGPAPQSKLTVKFATSQTNTNEGQGSISITLRSSIPAPARTRINFTTSGNAQSGSDYAVDNAVFFEAGSNTATLTVRIIENNRAEPTESVRFTISNDSDVESINPKSHLVVIDDNDQSQEPSGPETPEGPTDPAQGSPGDDEPAPASDLTVNGQLNQYGAPGVNGWASLIQDGEDAVGQPIEVAVYLEFGQARTGLPEGSVATLCNFAAGECGGVRGIGKFLGNYPANKTVQSGHPAFGSIPGSVGNTVTAGHHFLIPTWQIKNVSGYDLNNCGLTRISVWALNPVDPDNHKRIGSDEKVICWQP